MVDRELIRKRFIDLEAHLEDLENSMCGPVNQRIENFGVVKDDASDILGIMKEEVFPFLDEIAGSIK